jgi:Uma2 family endonuclease
MTPSWKAVMTAALTDRPPAEGWTTDDLAALPEDGLRRELLDGVLVVYPSLTDIHQIIAARLMVALEATCPADLHVTQAVTVRISPRQAFIPDVLVTTDAAARRRAGCYAPQEVMLAVEIVSPSSQSMDRVMKPALYAKAGIPFYWLVETDGGLTVHNLQTRIRGRGLPAVRDVHRRDQDRPAVADRHSPGAAATAPPLITA